MRESSMSIDFSAPLPSHNREIQRIFDDVLMSPIKKILRLETEVVGDNKDTLLTFSLTPKSQMTIDRRISPQRHSVQESIDQVVRICERRLYDEIKKEVIEAIANKKRVVPPDDLLLYGMPFRILDGLELEDCALIILSPKKYNELREKEADSRQGWIFTR